MITVIFKGMLSQERKTAASMSEARRYALEFVDRIGPSAWQHTIVQDSSGYEHRPAELWGEISAKV
jgi:hypothetical protein